MHSHPCTMPCTAQLARRPRPIFDRHSTWGIRTTRYCCYTYLNIHPSSTSNITTILYTINYPCLAFDKFIQKLIPPRKINEPKNNILSNWVLCGTFPLLMETSFPRKESVERTKTLLKHCLGITCFDLLYPTVHFKY